MPLLRVDGSNGGMAGAIRRLMAGGGAGLTPMQEMQADSMAADTAHKTLLGEEVRKKLERQTAADRARTDPGEVNAFASHSAGINPELGERLRKHIMGVRERPVVEVDDEGNRMPDVTYAAPEDVSPSGNRIYRATLAALKANNFATGTTNAEQLAHAAERITGTELVSRAADEPNVPTANRLIAAVSRKVREPFKVDAHGQVLNAETGALDDRGELAQANVGLAGSRAAAERALAGERGAHAGLFKAQTDKVAKEASGADDGLPAQQFKSLTGAKLSELPPEVRLQWIQNHAGGMTPQENLAALRQTARRDALVNEARLAYEAAYPKTMMGQRPTGAPDFLTFAEQYVAQKEGGARVPQAVGAVRTAQGRIRGPGEPQAQQLARPKTQADFDALPRGATYIDPDDGKTYRKR